MDGLVVIGSSIGDNGATDLPSGEVCAFDARTGARRWTFDPIPQNPADPHYNSWLGDNRYANSIVALHGSTGAIAWQFQTVHHDLWDYDNASPPALVTITKDGRKRDVVIEATKTGQLFVLDRDTGEPVFPVEERPVPRSDVPGEQAWPTQPFNTVIPPLSPQGIDSTEIWSDTPATLAACRAMIRPLRNDGVYTPPSLRGTIQRPSNVGGAAWGGVAFDAHNNTIIVPENRVASIVQLIDSAEYSRDHESWGGFALGGPIVTAGGVVFQAGTLDRQVRAYDAKSGKELWHAQLPSGARMTPMTYISARDGRQYMVVTAGGRKEFGAGDYVMAFALPVTPR